MSNVLSCLGLIRASVLQIQMMLDKAALLAHELSQDFFFSHDMKLNKDDKALILHGYSDAGVKNEIVCDYVFSAQKLLNSLVEMLDKSCVEAKTKGGKV